MHGGSILQFAFNFTIVGSFHRLDPRLRPKKKGVSRDDSMSPLPSDHLGRSESRRRNRVPELRKILCRSREAEVRLDANKSGTEVCRRMQGDCRTLHLNADCFLCHFRHQSQHLRACSRNHRPSDFFSLHADGWTVKHGLCRCALNRSMYETCGVEDD